MRQVCHSVEEMEQFAERWLGQLRPNAHGATVVGLVGDLGSGKTTFTQALGRALGVTEPMTSPTFVIQKRYQLKGLALMDSQARPWEQLVHIDAYRLGSARELLALNWEELAATPNSLILIEWADRVAEILPDDRLLLQFTFIDDQTREVKS